MKQKKSIHSEDFLIPLKRAKKCSICGRRATFAEVSFGSPICSTECAKQMWKNYVDTQFSRRYRIIDWIKD